jgi:hypothetical protein
VPQRAKSVGLGVDEHSRHDDVIFGGKDQKTGHEAGPEDPLRPFETRKQIEAPERFFLQKMALILHASDAHERLLEAAAEIDDGIFWAFLGRIHEGKTTR